MATLIPARNSCLPKMTGGEKRLSERLEQKLDADYTLWYDVPIGPKQRHPDFVVLHPHRGFLVLEVKDWKPDTIEVADRTTFTIRTERGSTKVVNPLMQARTYALEIAVTLERDAQLRQPAGPHTNKLCMPWGWGVVLANITRKRFEESGLDQVLDPSHVLCQDEMFETVDAEAFEERLWGMFSQPFRCALKPAQVDRVRWHLFPEIRLAAAANQFGLFSEGPAEPTNEGLLTATAIPDILRVMDLQQEQLARSLGGGHRVIHGVAGSGKTMILGYRCVMLARTRSKPILVLCYNVALAARLAEIMDAHGIADRVHVRHFHGWCGELLAQHRVPKPTPGIGAEAYTRGLVENALAAIEDGRIPRGLYGAVLIDEGHDFAPDWFRVVVPLVDPTDDALLILYDTAQSLYDNAPATRLKFSFASVGIQARGRTTVLKVNYRNTLEVLTVARAFAASLLDAADADDDGVPVVAPQSAGRRGRLPELVAKGSVEEEAAFVANRVRDAIDEGRHVSDIGILYRGAEQLPALEHHLRRAGVPYRVAVSREQKQALFQGPPAVKLVTMHSSKGLEFKTVFIPAAGQGAESRWNTDPTDEAKLLYVAMTRATEQLVMSYHRPTALTERLTRARDGACIALAA